MFYLKTFRVCHQEVFYEKRVFRNFAKFTTKHLFRSIFFVKVAGLQPATLLKKRLWHRNFPVNFAKFLTTPILQDAFERLLLRFVVKLITYIHLLHFFLFSFRILFVVSKALVLPSSSLIHA